MNFTRITSPTHPLYAEAINLYKISFPLHEQREEESQTEILTNSSYHFDVVCDHDKFIGEILYWDIGAFRYIEHFCILPSMRNQHYGQKILTALQDTPLILEIDPPVDTISSRRKGFYERCGFVENPYTHTHPPYHKGNNGHDLVVMSSPKGLTPEEYGMFSQKLQSMVMANAIIEKSLKPKLNGTAETMLQCFYARAMHSKNPKNKFHDAKAEELVERLDYDFSRAKDDAAMSSGIVARSVVFDELVSEFIKKYPNCTVVNIACGLDTRAYRMDNGKLTWYNLDLPETIEVRDSIYQESGRISTIACSVLDPAWADQVKVRGRMLFVIEGLTMYMTGDEVKTMLGIIRDHFDNAYVCMECLCPFFVKKEGIEKSIKATGASFTWGANCFADLGDIAEGYQKVKDDNIVRGMLTLTPLYGLVAWMPIVKKFAEKILVFEKKQ